MTILFQFIECMFPANLAAILSSATAKLFPFPNRTSQKLFTRLAQKILHFYKGLHCQVRNYVNFLKGRNFCEQIFASLTIYRENKFTETYKVLISLENLLCKIWESFNSKKRLN